jgi:hypothetical protein
MRKQFTGEVKRLKPKGKAPKSKTPKDPGLAGTSRRAARETVEQEQSLLKTAGGTPIVQRTPEG